MVHLLALHCVIQNWLRLNCNKFINKNEWLTNLLKFDPLDCHVWELCWKLTISCIQSPKQFSSEGCIAVDLDSLDAEIQPLKV